MGGSEGVARLSYVKIFFLKYLLILKTISFLALAIQKIDFLVSLFGGGSWRGTPQATPKYFSYKYQVRAKNNSSLTSAV